MDKNSLVLKRDELGRVLTPRERRALLVGEFQRSGLSADRFAQLAGVRYHTFWNWLREHGLTARRGKKRAQPKPRLVEVGFDPTQAAVATLQPSGLEVSLPGGAAASLRQTLCGWMGMTHEACSLIIEQIKRDVFQGGYVMADETPVKYQDPERKGMCGTGYLWVFHNPVRNVSLFAWRTGRGAACLESIVPPEFQGIIQCDGYSAYEAFIKTPARAGRIELAGCMAHMRRKFFEAKDEGEDPQWMLAQVQQLYRIEARLREARAGPQEVLTTRQQHSVPIMACIKARLEHLQASHKHRPRSLTGEAKCLPTETNQTVHRLTPKAWVDEQTAKCHALAQSAIVAV